METDSVVSNVIEVLHNAEPNAKLLCYVEVEEKDRNVSLEPHKERLGTLPIGTVDHLRHLCISPCR